MVMKLGDLSGNVYGRLTVISLDKIDEEGKKFYFCSCSCDGKIISVMQYYLTTGQTRSCRCLSKEMSSNRFKKYNEYDLESNLYGIGYTLKGEEFIFSKEDYDLIKDVCWRYSYGGYLVGRYSIQDRDIQMGRMILGLLESSEDIFAEHMNRNRGDNRRENLRSATQTDNMKNQSLQERSRTGIIGVNINVRGKYTARLVFEGYAIPLGSHENFNDAVYARLVAEKKYFGEYAPQKHLYSKYGIEE